MSYSIAILQIIAHNQRHKNTYTIRLTNLGKCCLNGFILIPLPSLCSIFLNCYSNVFLTYLYASSQVTNFKRLPESHYWFSVFLRSLWLPPPWLSYRQQIKEKADFQTRTATRPGFCKFVLQKRYLIMKSTFYNSEAVFRTRRSNTEILIYNCTVSV